MEPTIQHKPGFTAIGLSWRGKGPSPEIPQLWDVFSPRMAEVPHQASSHESFGVIDNYNPATGEFDYTACVAVNDTSQIPAGMVSKTVPPNRYAVFPCTLPTVQQAFADAQAWLATSSYRRKMAPEFELYDATFEGGADDQMYVYIPIEG
ncbi:MAG TPA: GyrI-like domain-containing protein [Aggregatilineales bacterium]|nr:GyrI-like domain-containing protein [Aggregatilineales bacterium]